MSAAYFLRNRIHALNQFMPTFFCYEEWSTSDVVTSGYFPAHSTRNAHTETLEI